MPLWNAGLHRLRSVYNMRGFVSIMVWRHQHRLLTRPVMKNNIRINESFRGSWVDPVLLGIWNTCNIWGNAGRLYSLTLQINADQTNARGGQKSTCNIVGLAQNDHLEWHDWENPWHGAHWQTNIWASYCEYISLEHSVFTNDLKVTKFSTQSIGFKATERWTQTPRI